MRRVSRWLWVSLTILVVVAAAWRIYRPPHGSLVGEGFTGDTRRVAAGWLGVTPGRLELTPRKDLDGAAIDLYQVRGVDLGPYCMVSHSTGMVFGVQLGQEHRKPAWRRAVSEAGAKRRAVAFLRRHGLVLPAETRFWVDMVPDTASQNPRWRMHWRYQRQGVELPEGLTVEMSAEGGVLSVDHWVYPLQVSLQPRISQAQGVEAARREWERVNGPGWRVKNPQARLAVEYFPIHPRPQMSPTAPGYEAALLAAAQAPRTQRLAWVVGFWLVNGICSQPDHPDITIHVDALTGTALETDAPC